MEEEHPFRLILIVGCAILFPMIAYYRLKSQAAGDRLDRRQEGYFILVMLRALGISCMLALLAYMIDPTWMAWSSMALPKRLRWAAGGLGLVAGTFLIWTLRSLGRNLTDTVVTRREHTLVTSGPYRLVRHPFYVSVALAIAANALAAANWFVLGSGAVALVLIAIRTRKEEQLLLARFGDAYRTYMERTGRFLPRSLGARDWLNEDGSRGRSIDTVREGALDPRTMPLCTEVRCDPRSRDLAHGLSQLDLGCRPDAAPPRPQRGHLSAEPGFTPGETELIDAPSEDARMSGVRAPSGSARRSAPP